MNKRKTHKWISYFRSGIYLLAALVCFIIIFSFSETDQSKSIQESLSIRIMIYNIHHGEGLDGVVDLQRIASIVNDENPDIVLLQEVDVNLERSAKINILGRLS